MELQPKYHVYLDYKGYMIEPTTYRSAPAPLLGSKFSMGRPSYSELDFWQIGGMTDFSHGINQKFMVDPARLFNSVGLDLSKPGEMRLEKDLQAYTMPATSTNITAHYRTLTKLYIGDDSGKIWSTTTGSAFYFEHDTQEDKIYSFYECEKKLFAACGSGNTWVNTDPDNSTTWTKISDAIKVDGLYKPGETMTPSITKSIYSTFAVCQQIKPVMSSETFNTLKIYLKKEGSPTNDLVINIYPESALTPGYPDLDATSLATYTLAPAEVSATAGYQEFSPDGSADYTLNAKVNYFTVATSSGGDSSNCYKWYYVNGPRAQYAYGGELETDLLQMTTPAALSGGYYSEDIASSANVQIQACQSFTPTVTSDKFYAVSLMLGKTLSPLKNLIVTIEGDNAGKPDGSPIITYTVDSSLVDNSFRWVEKKATTTFQLLSGVTYWVRAKCTEAPVTGNFYNWARNTASVYPNGTAMLTTDGGTTWSTQNWDFAFKVKTTPEWKANEFENMLMTIKSDTVTDLYYVHNNSDVIFGWFDDGVRQSIDGYNWIPEPPDPLWVMPSGEGTTLNAISIPRGFLSGSQRGLWMFAGGGSGYNIWKFPDYTSTSNFRGMDSWSYFGIFSVEEQGVYFTEGSSVFPSNLTYLEEGFTFKSCRFIYASANDAYAIVSNDGSTWYLARCNMSLTPKPMYWWLVKQLTKIPVHMAAWDDQKIIVFYSDNTAEYFDKTANYYVDSGYFETPWIDEGMIRLQKLYSSLSLLLDSSPSGTSSTIGYKMNTGDSYITSSAFAGAGNEAVYELANPTLGNKIMIKGTLNGKTGDKTVTPVVTDVTWKFILQSPSEDTTTQKTYSFMVIGEDWIEQNTGEVQEFGLLSPRTRRDLMSDLWASTAKKQILNYIDADNKSEIGLEIDYVGTGASCILTVDRTNFTISTAIDGVAGVSYDYENKTLAEVATYFNNLADYTCNVHQDQLTTRTAHDMEPRNDLEIKGGAYVAVGDKVYRVLLASASLSKKALEGRGSDRMMITLRDA